MPNGFEGGRGGGGITDRRTSVVFITLLVVGGGVYFISSQRVELSLSLLWLSSSVGVFQYWPATRMPRVSPSFSISRITYGMMSAVEKYAVPYFAHDWNLFRAKGRTRRADSNVQSTPTLRLQ